MTSIKNTQKLEKIYKDENELYKVNQEAYFQTEKNLSENVKKVIKVISEKLISSINNILLLIKNNFLTQEKRIESYLNEVKGKSKIEENMNNFFEKNNQEKKSYNLIKYNLKVLKEGKENNDSKKKFSGKNILNLFGNKNESDISKKDKIIYIKDDLEEMPFIDDEISLLTAKKMLSSFTLVNDGCFKLDIEEEKTTTKKLSMKIFVDFKKPKLSDNENIINEIKDDEEKEEKKNNEDFVIINDNIISITEKEIKSFERLLDKHHNRVIFLQQLNNFRSTGKHLIPIKLSGIVIHFFNIILDTVKRDNDIHSAKNIILMSQIYYTDDKSKKHYLQEYIIDHKLFKDSKFWEAFIESEINKEIKKLKESQKKLGINNQNDNNKINEIKNKTNLFDSIYFGQIMTISENMIKFGLSKDQIYQIIEPKIKAYELSQEMIDNIKNIISTRFNEINKKND